jgi:dTDP-4-amino-4,6-dideoxygalactose transaminase
MRGRDFSRQHLRNCADLPYFREFYADCPNARAAARELILLPTYPRYPMNEVVKNAEVIADFSREK